MTRTEELVERVERPIRTIARSFTHNPSVGKRYDVDDLYQDGMVVLMETVSDKRYKDLPLDELAMLVKRSVLNHYRDLFRHCNGGGNPEDAFGLSVADEEDKGVDPYQVVAENEPSDAFADVAARKTLEMLVSILDERETILLKAILNTPDEAIQLAEVEQVAKLAKRKQGALVMHVSGHAVVFGKHIAKALGWSPATYSRVRASVEDKLAAIDPDFALATG